MVAMTPDTSSASRPTISVRIRWVIGLTVFAMACFAVMGWLFDRPFHDGAGNRLVLYAGWHDGEFAVLACLLGGLALGTALVLLIAPPVSRIRSNALFVLVQLVLLAAGTVLLLFWILVLFFAMLGAGMGAMDSVTAPNGQRVLLDRSIGDQDIVSVWVPDSPNMYVEAPNSGFPTETNIETKDCSLNADVRPWILTCQGFDVILAGTH